MKQQENKSLQTLNDIIAAEYLDANHPAAKLSFFSAPISNESDSSVETTFSTSLKQE